MPTIRNSAARSGAIRLRRCTLQISSRRTVRLRAIGEDEWEAWRPLRLEALREAPYAFGSTLDDWQGAGDSEERWRARLSRVPLNLIAYLDDLPAGIVSGMPADEAATAELISMWVAPFARGCGVGDALVKAVIHWAQERRFVRVTLAVTDGNEYATALYRRHGFTDAEAVEDGERTMSLALEERA